MKEAREFEAADEKEAVKAAARELGIPEEEIEYRVTEAGSRGFLGVGAKPARIVVEVPNDREKLAGGRVEDEIERFQGEAVRRMRLQLDVRVESTGEYVLVSLAGQDRDTLLQNRAELLDAFQYLLNRIFSKRLKGRRAVVDCDGFRQRKEEELRQIARRLSQKVKLTGREQELGQLNPYERRIVHLTVAGEGGVTSESTGEGFLKKVTIKPV